MLQRLVIFLLIVFSPNSLGGCSINQIYLSKTPRVFEADMIRACEFLQASESGTRPALKSRHETMQALKAISPPGRLCFVCRRLRLCTFATQILKIGQDLDARAIIEKTATHFGKMPSNSDLPDFGGISLDQARSGMCRACATMPVRIQDGTWVEPAMEKGKS